MKFVRTISTVLFYVTRCVALVYALVAVYIIFVFSSYALAPDTTLMIQDAGRFVIYYPATSTPFLLGDYDTVYLSEMVGGITLYALFFWLLSDVFLTFRHSPLFTEKGVARLTRFYCFSIAAPIVVLSLMALFSISEPAAQAIGTLHVIFGIFTYFMAAIFKQGLELQVQQEFTI
jgi:hypothetical protein